MTQNPFWNAGFAALYIVGIVSLIQYGLASALEDAEKTIFIPIIMLSLLVLSAAIMGYIFFGQPLQMYLDGKKKEAVHLFLKTVAVFASIPALIFFALFFGILS
ncbi:MAG: hypothetical protein HYY92_02290 [Parcubacteria group bacterium]|nr:hypothetical protein [Parcubacteria group bacterium]